MGPLCDEDRVLLAIGRRIRRGCAVEYERFIRHAVKSLHVVELHRAGELAVDLTAQSSDHELPT
jgi:hypothetical protein